MVWVFKLRCAVKQYHWGKLGMQSTIAQLNKSAFTEFEVNEDIPYAEMWMGTHPSGPSIIPTENNMTLMAWIQEHPESLGCNIRDQFGDSAGLPFLFKVLSVRKALSIQVHPDKATAMNLHKEFTDYYPDGNHKPEIAIALTEFEALCGFRPISEIKSFLTELPQLQNVIGRETVDDFLNTKAENQKGIKLIFTALMTCKEQVFQGQLSDLVSFFENNTSLSDLCKSVKDIFLRVHADYPADIGCFCLFFLNYLILDPGQAIYLAANEPHAYLQGDCIECMACSDNVVRAGLTPKFKDVETLCDILTYKCKPGKDNIFSSINDVNNPHIKIYDPPVSEFTVAKIDIPTQDFVYLLEILDSASILIIVEGTAVASSSSVNPNNDIELHHGTVLFLSCGAKLQLQITSPRLLMFRAYCNN